MSVTRAEFDALVARVAAIEEHLGIAPDPEPEPEPPVTYTVQPGDTLSGIAGRTGLTVPLLVEWNELPDPDLLRVGQVLRLTAPAPQPEPEPSAPAAPTGLAAVVHDDRTVLLSWNAPAS